MVIKIFFNIIILVGLIRLLIATEKPFLCSGIYAVAYFFVGMYYGAPFLKWSGLTLIAFILSSLYFWLLNRNDGFGFNFWLIFIAGLIGFTFFL